MPLHVGKGSSLSSALGRTVDYVENPDKTNEGEFISSYECDPMIAEQEFLFSKSQYASLTGRNQGKNDVIAYHLRQSFKPDEVDAQTANKIGYDLAMSLTKGKHAFIVCTHIDKAHIHSHIVFNSTALSCDRKFRNFWNSSFAIRKISDKLCLENGLSIIAEPKQSKGHYGKWLGDSKPPTFSEKLKVSIDDVLATKPKSFDTFLIAMNDKGYEVKDGKYIAFKSAEQKKFIRLKSLGSGYSQDEIKAVIDGKTTHRALPKQEKKVNLLVDIQQQLNHGKGAGYEQWAKIFNLKQIAKTLNYLQENNLLNYEDLCEKSDSIHSNFDELRKQIKHLENEMQDVNELKTHVINYVKTKDIYAEYKKSGFSSKFYSNNETALILNKGSKKFFSSKNLEKLPTVKSLQDKYLELASERKSIYPEYNLMKKQNQEMLIAKANIEQILNLDEKKKSKEKSLQGR